MPTWLPDWVAVVGGVVVMLSLILGGIAIVVRLMVDTRVRKQMAPFIDSIEMELSTIRHNQGEMSEAQGRLYGIVSNGLTDQMKALRKQMQALYDHLLDD